MKEPKGAMDSLGMCLSYFLKFKKGTTRASAASQSIGDFTKSCNQVELPTQCPPVRVDVEVQEPPCAVLKTAMDLLQLVLSRESPLGSQVPSICQIHTVVWLTKERQSCKNLTHSSALQHLLELAISVL